jgi:CRISPR-associated protein Cmr6
MVRIVDAYKKVPMMFRAQVGGRCQLQRIDSERQKNGEVQDIELWTQQWTDKAYPIAPTFGGGVRTHDSYTMSWRFVTNGGQDDGVIRPVIGAYGWPFYPGSSMKGAFRKACTPDEADRYCGKKLPGGDFEPGILRFQGGYPVDDQWQDQLVDIIHPQQERQVQREKTTSAFAQISLHQPTLQFGISSTEPLHATEWQTIWQIWEKALTHGLGCRVSAGYGQVRGHTGSILYQGRIKGQGQAPKLLNQAGEFRPNVFRAAIRGHALRLFGGLLPAEQAEQLVNQLFGSVRGSGDVGLLSMSFQTDRLHIGSYGRDRWEQPTYEVEGELIWMLNRLLSDKQQRKTLANLIKALTHFAMVFGGFGKSWRRADHRLFYPDYAEQDYKPLIGCHWQWADEEALTQNYKVRELRQITPFIESIRSVARTWIELQDIALDQEWASDWCEAWHPEQVQVWGRIAETAENCVAARWLHMPYRERIASARIAAGSIYRSSVTGQMGQIGRLWHRMYPVARLVKPKDDPNGKPLVKMPANPKYIELLTLFPDDSIEFEQFLHFLEHESPFLEHESPNFERLWTP